jgi:hypothetical protein
VSASFQFSVFRFLEEKRAKLGARNSFRLFRESTHCDQWSGKFDVEEGDSDWNSWIEVRFVQNAAKKQWLVSGSFLDGWDESKAIHFEKLPVLMMDEDGSAFFKFAGKYCYLFRHQTRGPVLIVESGFYEKEQ